MNSKSQGISQLALIPMRSQPSEQSEQVNQVLFGETFSILETQGNWSRIVTHFDNYSGWITSKMATLVSSNIHEKLKLSFVKEPLGRIVFPGNPQQFQWIPGGSTLYGEGSEFYNFNESFIFDPVCQLHTPLSKISVVETALKFLNAPYLWGGRTIMGIDCSGFSQIVYKMNGLPIKRDASQQAEQGTIINFIDESVSGDLAFFDNEEGRITHVGIVLENNRIIHASGQVRIDKLDHQGIYNEESQKYTHKLRLIRRVFQEK